MSVVELDRTDLVVLYTITKYRADKIERYVRQGYSENEASEMVDRLGISALWGHNNHIVTPEGVEMAWGEDDRPVPDGVVNRFIVAHDLGEPLFHSTQFYRIGDKLASAGWLIGRVDDKFYFTPRELAKEYVANTLDRLPPHRWPITIEVEAGRVTAQLKAR